MGGGGGDVKIAGGLEGFLKFIGSGVSIKKEGRVGFLEYQKMLLYCQNALWLLKRVEYIHTRR